jgi:ferric-dicitrate binding protein FerR (iron transport regulator)
VPRRVVGQEALPHLHEVRPGRRRRAVIVSAAALVVLILAVVWAWSERPATGQAEAAAAVLQGGAGAGGLPHDVP